MTKHLKQKGQLVLCFSPHILHFIVFQFTRAYFTVFRFHRFHYAAFITKPMLVRGIRASAAKEKLIFFAFPATKMTLTTIHLASKFPGTVFENTIVAAVKTSVSCYDWTSVTVTFLFETHFIWAFITQDWHICHFWNITKITDFSSHFCSNVSTWQLSQYNKSIPTGPIVQHLGQNQLRLPSAETKQSEQR